MYPGAMRGSRWQCSVGSPPFDGTTSSIPTSISRFVSRPSCRATVDRGPSAPTMNRARIVSWCPPRSMVIDVSSIEMTRDRGIHVTPARHACSSIHKYSQPMRPMRNSSCGACNRRARRDGDQRTTWRMALPSCSSGSGKSSHVLRTKMPVVCTGSLSVALRSRSATRKPLSASCRAHCRPARPAPTTTISKSMKNFIAQSMHAC